MREYELGRLLLIADRARDAEPIFTRLASRYPASIRLRGTLGSVAARAGDKRTARAVLAWLESRPPVIPPGLPGYYRAAILANTGDIGGAMDFIEALPYGAHPQEFLEFHVDPLLAPLHQEARFRRFLVPR